MSSSMEAQRLSGKYHRATEAAPGVLLLEFNRKPVNAFHDDMWMELHDIIGRISRSPEVRVIILSSALPKTWTAGLDLNSLGLLQQKESDPARKAVLLRNHILDFQAAISSLSDTPQPVIAAIHGVAVGLAIDILSACDIRIAASDTTFGIFEVNVGLAADIGTLQRFPKIVGNDSKAREIALSGRKFDAHEAKEIGFVSDVVQGSRTEVIAKAVEMGRLIASKSPVAVVGTKHLLNHARDHSVEVGLHYTAAWNMSMLQSADLGTAMSAALRKTTPIFTNLPSSHGPVKAKL